MKDPHISREELTALANGEVSGLRSSTIRKHLLHCWTCRAELDAVEETIAGFVRAHRETPVPSPEAPRAMFRARLADLAAQPRPRPVFPWAELFRGNRPAYLGGGLAAIAGLAAILLMFPVERPVVRLVPDPRWTPGATVTISAAELCRGEEPETRLIPTNVGREVFSRYGIERPRPRAYELDYLISPELGGAADVKNYWPQPYGASEWNAHVKDALEDRLHQLVCEHQVSLETAQREIASDWIAAYKKYFQTQQPIASHLAFTKDAPWEP